MYRIGFIIELNTTQHLIVKSQTLSILIIKIYILTMFKLTCIEFSYFDILYEIVIFEFK